MNKENEELRARSGSVDSEDPLVSFLYILLRDHLSAGKVEEIVRNHCSGSYSDSEFCNGYIANYAQETL